MQRFLAVMFRGARFRPIFHRLLRHALFSSDYFPSQQDLLLLRCPARQVMRVPRHACAAAAVSRSLLLLSHAAVGCGAWARVQGCDPRSEESEREGARSEASTIRGLPRGMHSALPSQYRRLSAIQRGEEAVLKAGCCFRP